MIHQKTPTVGYVPVEFPRDPVEVNQFSEHMFIGQILEPLVDSNRFGELEGGIAKSWKFSEDGLEIKFAIGSERKFSTGKVITPEDVAYSISRHLQSKSQAAIFLSDVVSVKVVAPSSVVLRLSHPNPAILKALTRDQLGIVPSGWKFDMTSDEPYVGSGAYRLIRKKKDWYLTANPHYHDSDKVRIKDWKIVSLSQPGMNQIPSGERADYVPNVTVNALAELRADKSFSPQDFEVSENVSYSQTSFWIYPSSTLFKDRTKRKFVVQLWDEAITSWIPTKSLKRATGIIPIGILGHNSKGAHVSIDGSPTAVGKIRIAALKGVFEPFLTSSEFKTTFQKHKVEIEIVPFTPNTLLDLKNQNVDIITGSWAGGFNDPTGFFGLLNPMLGMGFESYLGDMATLLKRARLESNWDLRAEKFREFDKSLVESGLIIPGWQVPTYSILRKNLRYRQVQSRYTERFINVVTAL